MTKPAVYSLLFGAVNVEFPWWKTQITTLKLPWFSLDIETPGFFFSTLVYFGIASLSYFAAKFLGSSMHNFYMYMKSF